ncbi:MAG: ParB/RepB/Spo0J family partition protein [Oscillospiraceae bacterium]|nr:ParB/RepB/Spo0J family partition protein [Oscillospiraceae bacterium]
MKPKKSGLGRGFDSLFLDNAAEGLTDGGAVSLKISEIEPDRSQPRTQFSEEALLELENSIREFGVLQPLLVRPMSDGSYKIVAGERRWRAARAAGLTEVPVIIRSLTEEEACAIALIENLQREDLNALEEAQGIARLIEEFGFTQEQAAARLSKSRPAIANSLRLLALPEKARKALSDGDISAGHARALLSLGDEEKINAALSRIIENSLSVRQTEALCKAMSKEQKIKAPKLNKDNFFNEVQASLSSVLSRKVKVTGSEKGGKIEIEFFDKEDLSKLIKAFDEE